MTVVDQPNADSLVLGAQSPRSAVPPKASKPYEVIPIALVLAAANTAAGHPRQEHEIYVELEALDGRTSQPMVRVVRRATAWNTRGDSEQLSLATPRAGAGRLGSRPAPSSPKR